MKMYDLDVLVTNKQIAKRYGITPSAVVNWRNRYDDFPEPVHSFDGSPVYDINEVTRWVTQKWGGEQK